MYGGSLWTGSMKARQHLNVAHPLCTSRAYLTLDDVWHWLILLPAQAFLQPRKPHQGWQQISLLFRAAAAAQSALYAHVAR